MFNRGRWSPDSGWLNYGHFNFLPRDVTISFVHTNAPWQTGLPDNEYPFLPLFPHVLFLLGAYWRFYWRFFSLSAVACFLVVGGVSLNFINDSLLKAKNLGMMPIGLSIAAGQIKVVC